MFGSESELTGAMTKRKRNSKSDIWILLHRY